MSDRVDVNDFTWPEITSRLVKAHVARLAFEGLDGPHVALIDASGDRDGRIVFCTGDDPQLDDLDGRTVAIEIDGCDAAIEHGWYITTVGTARNITADAHPLGAASRPPRPSPGLGRTMDRRRVARLHRSP